ncbi:polysaccharide deacetylase family protein [Caldibacillus lycopersici]|uniref:Polysaccharide deacetylase family protein n=1 Tax=Perspicuibacillus lycopersici TaxID=1325689 RepID=A0AAE3LPP4_9BACI|nr:polysaccharide deacetylase family protein [Perspicuibacillus lycopersici]MCU9615176.1 polysaccharide deacetylase family protein [Perspicuibacillus lycopersici]
MNYFLILNGKRLKNYAVIILTAFVTAWFFYIQNLSFSAFSTDDGPKAVYKGKNGIALTFNIAWGNSKAEPIIDLLVEKDVKAATFFLSGSWAEQHPNIVEKIAKAGYEIGLLGYEYLDYEEVEDKKIRQDILKAEEVFTKLNIKHKKILRAPNGHFDNRLLPIAEKLGYTVVHWSIDSKDWKNPGIETIVNNVSEAKAGDIILLHASDSAKETAVALPEILNKFSESKTNLVTISEILIDGTANSKEITD